MPSIRPVLAGAVAALILPASAVAQTTGSVDGTTMPGSGTNLNVTQNPTANPGGLSLGGAGTGTGSTTTRSGVNDPRQLGSGSGGGGGGAPAGAGIGGSAAASPSDEYLYPIYGKSLR